MEHWSALEMKKQQWRLKEMKLFCGATELTQPKDVAVASWMLADGSIDWSSRFCIPKLFSSLQALHCLKMVIALSNMPIVEEKMMEI
ncbi:hypothetical protein Lal_00008219 [Lupinus albus]|nr:hypothetical protein Lal_00008219 [Lupinus albus]